MANTNGSKLDSRPDQKGQVVVGSRAKWRARAVRFIGWTEGYGKGDRDGSWRWARKREIILVIRDMELDE